jgi:hypothetical protein
MKGAQRANGEKCKKLKCKESKEWKNVEKSGKRM